MSQPGNGGSYEAKSGEGGNMGVRFKKVTRVPKRYQKSTNKEVKCGVEEIHENGFPVNGDVISGVVFPPKIIIWIMDGPFANGDLIIQPHILFLLTLA